MDCLSSFVDRTIVQPFLKLMRQGLNTETLAMSFTVGFVGGVFPIPGVTSIVCLVICILFKLNIPSAQLVNLVATPLNLILIIPFIRLGDWIFQSQSISGSKELFASFKTDFFGSLKIFSVALLHGVVAWAVVSPVLFYILYKVIFFVLDYRGKAVHQV